MSDLSTLEFVPHPFGTDTLHDEPANESNSLPVTPSDLILLSDTERRQRPKKTIRLYYEAVNFQHQSGIARLFSPAFVSHREEGDTSGWAAIIEALPSITFALPDLPISLQFVLIEGDRIETHDRYTNIDLRPFLDAALGGIKITWRETLLWRLDEDGKIVERWQGTVPVALLQQFSVTPLNSSR